MHIKSLRLTYYNIMLFCYTQSLTQHKRVRRTIGQSPIRYWYLLQCPIPSRPLSSTNTGFQGVRDLAQLIPKATKVNASPRGIRSKESSYVSCTIVMLARGCSKGFNISLSSKTPQAFQCIYLYWLTCSGCQTMSSSIQKHSPTPRLGFMSLWSEPKSLRFTIYMEFYIVPSMLSQPHINKWYEETCRH